MILTLRALGVGDLTTATPALRALRTTHPHEELALAAPHWLTPLVDLIGGIDTLLDTPGLGPIPWTGPPPHLAVNLHGHGPQSHHMLAHTRPDRLLAYTNPDAGHHDGPHWRDDEHEIHRWCRLLNWYDIPTDPTDLTLHRPPPDGLPTGVSIVHPGAKASARRWPPARFAAVARELNRRGHRVVVTGTPGERAIAVEVARGAGLPDTAVLAGETGIGELAALVAHGRLVVSGDTGIGHLATAYGTPSVLLFGPVSPALWGPPPGRPRHQALWAGPVAGRADAVPHPALAALDVPDVLAAVDRAERGAADGRVPAARAGWSAAPSREARHPTFTDR